MKFNEIRSISLGTTTFWASNVKFIIKLEIVSFDGDKLLGVIQKTCRPNELKFCMHLTETIKNGFSEKFVVIVKKFWHKKSFSIHYLNKFL